MKYGPVSIKKHDVKVLNLNTLDKAAVLSSSYYNLLKVTRAFLIHKPSSKFDFKNDIPTSVLHFPNLVFERATHFRSSKFDQNYEVIFEHQYSFLKNKTTNGVIPKFIQKC